jgi:hypothetical protein
MSGEHRWFKPWRMIAGDPLASAYIPGLQEVW